MVLRDMHYVGGGILAPVIHRSAHYYVHQRNDQQRFNIVMLLLMFPGNLGVPFFVGLFFASSDSFATILCCRIKLQCTYFSEKYVPYVC